MRLRTLVSVALLVSALSACSAVGLGGDDGSDGASARPEAGGSQNEGSGAGDEGSGSDPDLGDYEGLCSWVTPAQMEEIFGEPVDAVGFKDCRIVAEGDFDEAGIYHFTLDQQRMLDELLADRRRSGANGCESEMTTWQGMRLLRETCPNDSQSGGFVPGAIMELGPGRMLFSMPNARDDKASAVEASRVYAKIAQAFAQGMRGLPLINEVAPGKWLEIYNPTRKPISLDGYTIEAGSDTVDVPTGSSIPANGRLVLDLGGLTGGGEFDGDNGGWIDIVLLDAEGRPADIADGSSLSSVDGDEVLRRNGDGGYFCLPSELITKGKPNPPYAENCPE